MLIANKIGKMKRERERERERDTNKDALVMTCTLQE
jgi:hypothetical protein